MRDLLYATISTIVTIVACIVCFVPVTTESTYEDVGQVTDIVDLHGKQFSYEPDERPLTLIKVRVVKQSMVLTLQDHTSYILRGQMWR